MGRDGSSLFFSLYRVNILFSMMEMSMLAPTSPQSRCLPLGHANKEWLFRLAGAIVGVDQHANHLSYVGARQHAQDFPGLPGPLLAPTSLQSRCLPSSHANMEWIFPARGRHCWRRPPRKPFVFRWVTPTCSGFSRSAGVIVGVDLPANILSSVGSHQHGLYFSRRRPPMLASTFPQSRCLPSGHANMIRIISICRCP